MTTRPPTPRPCVKCGRLSPPCSCLPPAPPPFVVRGVRGVAVYEGICLLGHVSIVVEPADEIGEVRCGREGCGQRIAMVHR